MKSSPGTALARSSNKMKYYIRAKSGGLLKGGYAAIPFKTLKDARKSLPDGGVIGRWNWMKGEFVALRPSPNKIKSL